jgi:hypothetical protein
MARYDQIAFLRHYEVSALQLMRLLHNLFDSKANKEPWVLVSSLSLNTDNANAAVNIYRQRMRIEENIRDTKCPHYGLGLKKSLSRSPKRLNILLLISTFATFAAWIAGIETTRRGKAPDFQAHSAKFTHVLSKVFFGREAFKKRP